MPQRTVMRNDELSAIVHFAPVSLVVLDRTRSLVRVNRLAESMLGLDATMCTGTPFANWVSESTQPALLKALHHAAQAKWGAPDLSVPWEQPGHSTIAITPRRSATDPAGKPFWCNITISAYFDAPAASGKNYLHEASFIIHLSSISSSFARLTVPTMLTRPNEDLGKGEQSTSSLDQEEEGEVFSEVGEEVGAEPEVDARVEAGVPLDNDRGTFDKTSDFPRSIMSDLAEAVAYNVEYAIMCLSSDGHHTVRNRVADALLDSIASDPGDPDFLAAQARVTTEAPDTELPDNGIDVSWLFTYFRCFDPSFTHPLPYRDYPLYKCAILGQKFVHNVFGVQSKSGERHLIECAGVPLFDSSGEGVFIGGAIFLKDVTKEYLGPENNLSHLRAPNISPETATDIHMTTFKRVCEDLPEISWIANADGYLEWYNQRWYDYTGSDFDGSKGSSWTNFVHPADLPSIGKIWSKALRTESRYEVQERILAKDGSYRWMLCRAHPIKTPEGKVMRWFGMLTDIHSMLTALAQNREARENLSDAVRGAGITLWACDSAGVFTLAEGPLAMLDFPHRGNTPAGFSSSQSFSAGSSGSDDTRQDVIPLAEPTKAPIVGRSIFEEWGGQRKSPIMKALEGEHVTEESTIRGRTYRTQYRPRRAPMTAPTSFLLSHEPEDVEAPIVGVTGMSFDITERLAMERKFEESAREVARAEAASSAAKEASRMKSQFLAVISHEIRTPLNGVVGLSELLLDIENLPAEAQELVQSILRSSGALLTVINDVLDFSKVEAGKLDLVSLPFSLQLVCEDAARDFRRLIRSKGVELTKEIDLPEEIVLGDAGRITQVLNNLLANAGKFTERGTVLLQAHKVRDEGPLSYYSFQISDSGCGIPQTQLGNLFQPFRQADPSTSRKYGGSGLGLAICRNLIELMGGDITLQSEEGVGTTVSFTVPLMKSPGSTGRGSTPRDELQGMFSQYSLGERTTTMTKTMTTTKTTTCHTYAPPPSSLEVVSSDFLGLRRSSVVTATTTSTTMTAPLTVTPNYKGLVLLAEDNPLNARIAVKTLGKLEYDVDHAENGLEVLEYLAQESDDRPYDLILMDINMPLQDGYECTRLIRSQGKPHHRRLPIIACTAAVVQGRALAQAAGMTDFLGKPMRRADLAAMLSTWIGRSHEPEIQTVMTET